MNTLILGISLLLVSIITLIAFVGFLISTLNKWIRKEHTRLTFEAISKYSQGVEIGQALAYSKTWTHLSFSGNRVFINGRAADIPRHGCRAFAFWFKDGHILKSHGYNGEIDEEIALRLYAKDLPEMMKFVKYTIPENDTFKR